MKTRAAIELVGLHHGVDHRGDGGAFAFATGYVFGIEPVETGAGIVDRLLLRRQHGKAQFIGKLAPARAHAIAVGALAAAMQHHNQRRAGFERLGQIAEHPQIAGIGRERRFRQGRGGRRRARLRARFTPGFNPSNRIHATNLSPHHGSPDIMLQCSNYKGRQRRIEKNDFAGAVSCTFYQKLNRDAARAHALAL